MTNSDEQPPAANAISVDGDMFVSDSEQAQLDIDLTILGEVHISERFDEARIRKDILNWSSALEQIWDKLGDFDFVGAFQKLKDTVMGKISYGFKKDAVLGVFTYQLPTATGIPLTFSLDAFMSANFDISGGVSQFGLEGKFSPSAAVSVDLSMMIADQGTTVQLNSNTNTHNNIRFMFDYENVDYEVRIDTPANQEICSFHQEVTLHSPTGSEIMEGYNEPANSVELFGHNFYIREASENNCQFFSACTKTIDIGVERINPRMTHMLATLKNTDEDLWLFTLGISDTSSPFMVKAWYAEREQIHTVGGAINWNAENHYNLDVEYNVRKNEMKAQVEIGPEGNKDNNKYQLHGRAEINSDNTYSTLIVLAVPDHTVTALFHVVNQPERHSLALDIDGIGKARIHTDITYQDAQPQVASNLQIYNTDASGHEYNIGYKFEAAYNTDETSSRVQHSVQYIAQLMASETFEMSGNALLALKQSGPGWQFQMQSTLPYLDQPFMTNCEWKYENTGDVLNVKFIMNKFEIPSMLAVTNGVIKVLGDTVKDSYTMEYGMDYNLATIDAGNVYSKMVARRARNIPLNLDYKFTASSYPQFNHRAVVELVHVINSRNIIVRVETNAKANWGATDEPNKELSIQQLFTRSDKKASQEYKLGCNVNVLGNAIKYYSKMSYIKLKAIIVEIKLRHGQKDAIQTLEAAEFHLDGTFSSSKGKKVNAGKVILTVPSYIYGSTGAGIHAESNLELVQRGKDIFEYSTSFDLLEPQFNGAVAGVFINKHTQKKLSVSVSQSNEIFAEFATTIKTASKAAKDVYTVAVDFKFPIQISGSTFQVISSSIKGNLKTERPQNKHSVHMIFHTDHPEAKALEVSHIVFDSNAVLNNETFAFGVTGKCMTTQKKIHLGVEYPGDNTAALDFRQTIDASYPASVGGSAIYHPEKQLVVMNFNRDKNPITARVSWAIGDKAFVRLDTMQNDAKLSGHNIPVESSFVVEYNTVGEFDHSTNLKYNLTWTRGRTTSAAVGARVSDTIFQLTAISEDNTIQGFPQKMESSLMINYGDPENIVYKAKFELPTKHLSFNVIGGAQFKKHTIIISHNIANNMFVGPYRMVQHMQVNDNQERIFSSKVQTFDDRNRETLGQLTIDFGEGSFHMQLTNEFSQTVRSAQIQYGETVRVRRDTGAKVTSLTMEARGEDPNVFNHLIATGSFSQSCKIFNRNFG